MICKYERKAVDCRVHFTVIDSHHLAIIVIPTSKGLKSGSQRLCGQICGECRNSGTSLKVPSAV